MRGSTTFQVVTADLAMILFLTTLAALAVANKRQHEAAVREQLEIASSQSLFRAQPGGVAFPEWLAQQQRDPRQSLTIFVHYRPQGRAAAWERAEEMERQASAAKRPVRLIVEPSDSDEVYASLAYDSPAAAAGSAGLH